MFYWLIYCFVVKSLVWEYKTICRLKLMLKYNARNFNFILQQKCVLRCLLVITRWLSANGHLTINVKIKSWEISFWVKGIPKWLGASNSFIHSSHPPLRWIIIMIDGVHLMHVHVKQATACRGISGLGLCIYINWVMDYILTESWMYRKECEMHESVAFKTLKALSTFILS